VFENEKVKDRLFTEFSHKVSLRKISEVEESKSPEKSMIFNDLALCDISIIGHNKQSNEEIDNQFRKLAF